MASVAFLLLIVAVVVVVVTFFQRLNRPNAKEPTCGKCGYLVKGLTTFTCPECGSDLREVGIATPETRRPLPPLAKAILWTIALPLPAIWLSALVFAFGPTEYRVTDTCLFTPHSDAYSQLTLVSRGSGLHEAHVRPQTLTFRLTLNSGAQGRGNAGDLIVYMNGSGYGYVRQDGQKTYEPNGFNAKVILGWMAEAGINANDPATQNEANDLFAQALALTRNGTMIGATPAFRSAAHVRHDTWSGSPTWLSAGLLIFWLAVWALGLWRTLGRKTQPSRRSSIAGAQSPLV